MPEPSFLVVKNGVNIFSFTSSVMPTPLSATVITTLPAAETTRAGTSPEALTLGDTVDRILEALAANATVGTQ